MPRQYLIYPDGRREQTEKKHRALHYKGIVSEDKATISGEWKFKTRIIFLFGFIPVLYSGTSGAWGMSKSE